MRLAGEAKEMRRLEGHKRKHLDHEADVEFQKELSKAIEESKASVWKKWAASNPTIPLPLRAWPLAAKQVLKPCTQLALQLQLQPLAATGLRRPGCRRLRLS